MRVVTLSGWVALSAFMLLSWNGQGQPFLVSAAHGSRNPERGRFRQVSSGRCGQADKAALTGDTEQVEPLHLRKDPCFVVKYGLMLSASCAEGPELQISFTTSDLASHSLQSALPGLTSGTHSHFESHCCGSSIIKALHNLPLADHCVGLCLPDPCSLSDVLLSHVQYLISI
jgi:hypothetical protein